MNTLRSTRSRVARGPVLLRPAVGIDDVAGGLAAEFDGTLPAEVITMITLGARRDLEREVPPESLAEFTHRLAWQRLLDLVSPDAGFGGSVTGPRSDSN